MKRVYLHLGTDAELVQRRQRTAMALVAAYLAGGTEGRIETVSSGLPQDPIFEWVTEGRQRENTRRRAQQRAAGAAKIEVPYSACGDGCQATASLCGVRTEKIVNRSSDGGSVPWVVGANLWRFSQATIFQHAGAELPKLGDIVYVQSPDHVFIALSDAVEGETQRRAEYGRLKAIGMGPRAGDIIRSGCGTHLVQRENGKWKLGDRYLYGFIPATSLPFVESAWIPTEEEASFDPLVRELYDALMALEPTDDDNPIPETDQAGRASVEGAWGLPAWSSMPWSPDSVG